MPLPAGVRTLINSKRLTLGATALLAGWSVVAIAQQQQEQQPQRPGVQVGVPEGRGPGGAANGPAGRGRGRNPGPPPGPAPRNADGRVLLSGATPKDKGVWLPGGGGGQTVQSGEPIPFQPWAKALLADRAEEPARAAHAVQAVGLRASVPDALRRRVRGAAGDRSRLHLRYRRPAHLSRDLHGRPHASGESLAVATTATRSAGGKATRSSSTPSDTTRGSGSTAAAHRTPRSCTRSRSSRAPTIGRSTTRRSWTIPAPTPSRGRIRSICDGKREQSSSSTSASR